MRAPLLNIRKMDKHTSEFKVRFILAKILWIWDRIYR